MHNRIAHIHMYENVCSSTICNSWKWEHPKCLWTVRFLKVCYRQQWNTIPKWQRQKTNYYYIQQQGWISQIVGESYHTNTHKVHTAWFHLYKVLKRAKLINSVRIQTMGHLWGQVITEKKAKEGFGGDSNLLFFDVSR